MLKAQRKLQTDTAKDLEMLLSELTGEGRRKLSYQSREKGQPTESTSTWVRTVQGSLCPHSQKARHSPLAFQKLYYQDWGALCSTTTTSNWHCFRYTQGQVPIPTSQSRGLSVHVPSRCVPGNTQAQFKLLENIFKVMLGNKRIPVPRKIWSSANREGWAGWSHFVSQFKASPFDPAAN